MKRKDGPGARRAGAEDTPAQTYWQRQQAPDLRLASDIRQAYRDESDQDQRSLERVLARLLENQAPGTQRVGVPPGAAHPPERIAHMHTRTAQWKHRITLFAAFLCTLVLIGGFLTLAHAGRVNHTSSVGSQQTLTSPPTATTRPISHAIQKAILTAFSGGKGEGIGPGLSGLTPEDHFQVDQVIRLFVLVGVDNGGTVSARWYANGLLLLTSSLSIPAVPPQAPVQTPVPTPARNAPVVLSVPIECSFHIIYTRPATGKVELYWNGQVALALTFVVHA